MDKTEAQEILAKHLQKFRRSHYSALVKKIKTHKTFAENGPSGVTYQLEFQFFWDDKPNGNVRVLGSIDDSGWRAFLPLSDSFIMSPDGAFIGENEDPC